MILVGTSLVSLGVGMFLGDLLSRRLLEAYYMKQADKEIASAREMYFLAKKSLDDDKADHLKAMKADLRDIEETRRKYEALYKTGRFETPESAANHLIPKNPLVNDEPLPPNVIDALTSYVGETKEELGEEMDGHTRPKGNRRKKPSDESSNPPPSRPPSTIYGQALQNFVPPSKDEPYIITQEDFLACLKDYEQNTLTYYEGDGVLADDQDQSVEDINTTIGAKGFKFGYLSEDPNVFYVRNDRLRMEFEVVRSPGKYSVEVLGEDDPEVGPNDENRR